VKKINNFFISTAIILIFGLIGMNGLNNGIKNLFAQEESLDAEFSGDPTSGDAPLTVNFTDESTGNIIEWSWDFGDGGSSMDQNPTHQYTQPGTYTVTLSIVDDEGNTDEEVKDNYIQVTTPTEGLDADFSANPTSGQPPLTVNFTDQSTGNVVRWEWDFDNNGVIDSTVQNPSFIYNEEGTYSVKLTVYDDNNNSNTELKTDYINVSGAVTSETLIQINRIETNLTEYPASPNVPITFTTYATSAGGETLYYKYWIIPDYCSPSYDTTWEIRDYSTDNTFTWTPTEEGNYVVAVYVTDEPQDVCPSVARLSFGVFLLGTLELEVVDATTADPIEGATVEIGGLTATTDQEGKATITNIASGTYTLKVSHPDYITAEQEVNILGNETVFNTVALSPGLAEGQIRIVLTWGATPPDLDSHLTGPDGEGGTFHVYYANKNPTGAEANLDVDDVTSYGPETVTIEELHSGMYEYHVLDFTNCGCSDPSTDPNPQSTALSQSEARVEIYSGNSLLTTFEVPSGYGTNWHVFDINGETGEIIPVNTLGGGSGATSPDNPLAFCDNNPGYCVGNFQAPDDDTKGLAWDGTNLWVCEGAHAFSVIFKMDVETGECLDYFFSPGPNPQGLAWDGNYLWNLDQTDHKIYKIDPSTKTVVDFIPTPTDNPEDFYTGLAWDGEDFWVAGYRVERNNETYLYEVTNSAIYKMSLTATTSLTGTATVSLTIPLEEEYKMPLGLAHDGDNLWISTYNSTQIWRMDPDTGEIADTGKPAPNTGTYGMTWDGLYLWTGSWHSRYIVQLNPRFAPTFTEAGSLRINIIRLSTNASTLPLPVNTPITFVTDAVGQAPTLYYKYFVSPGYCSSDFGEWEELQSSYSTNNTIEWTPTSEDDYVIRVLVTDNPSSSCQAMGDISVVVGNGGVGGGSTGSPGGTQ